MPVWNRNLVEARPSFVSHLECSATGEIYPADQVHTVSRAGKPLLVRYDLEAARNALTQETFEARPADMWRWREILPVRGTEDIVSLGEAATPLSPLDRAGAVRGARAPLVKDEGRLPTGSFKARGLSAAVTMAAYLGAKHLAIPSAGNAAGALAAYAARAGLSAHIFMPQDVPAANRVECQIAAAEVTLVSGFITDCARQVAEGVAILFPFRF